MEINRGARDRGRHPRFRVGAADGDVVAELNTMLGAPAAAAALADVKQAPSANTRVKVLVGAAFMTICRHRGDLRHGGRAIGSATRWADAGPTRAPHRRHHASVAVGSVGGAGGAGGARARARGARAPVWRTSADPKRYRNTK